MSRYITVTIAVLVLVLLGSTAGLVAASRISPDIPDQPALLAAGYGPQPTDDDDDECVSIKFEGMVDAVVTDDNGDLVSIEVDGVTVQINEDTEIKHGPITDETVGAWVEVKGCLQEGDIVIAKKIKIKDDHGHGDECRKHEFYGKLIEFTGTAPGDAWTIETPDGPVTVFIDGNTEIKGEPAIGALVKVEACRQTDGTLLAQELKVRDHPDEDHDDRVEFHATITGPDPFFDEPWWGVWELGGRWLVEVTSRTAIVGTPALRKKAEVHGTKVGPTRVIASKIEIEDRHPPGQGVEIVKIEGAITDIPSNPKAVGAVWEIEGIPITVVTDTLILDHRISLPTPPIGDDTVWVDVHALVQDGSYYAKRVKTRREDEQRGEVHFEGNFEGTAAPPDEQIWIVSGWPFDVSSVVDVSVPAPGTRVKIKAIHNVDTDTYVAFRVKVKGEDHD